MGKTDNKKQTNESSFHQVEKAGFRLEISAETQVILSKGIILVIIVVVMGVLAYLEIFESVVWSSLMTIAGYVAFANSKKKTTENG